MTPLRLLYLVHDLADAAVAKRITMLQDGGAQVTVAGFRRSEAAPATLAGVPVIDLGRTYNGGFAQRIMAVFAILLKIRRFRQLFAENDMIIARNLEMLAIGVRGRAITSPKPVLVYESLDIHRLLLNQGPVGKILRWLEGWLSRRASALLTSSPAFVEHYFTPLSHVRLPVRLVENKVYNGENAAPLLRLDRTGGPPWRIGWFGAIRCRKSLDLLSALAERANGQVEVIIRGKPSYDQFEDFDRQTKQNPHLRFLGPYKNPDDLEQIYADVHFTWAIDMFEEGQNSSWLLPNRIYEGGRHGAVPLALENVETGRFLQRLQTGATFKKLTAEALANFFAALTSLEYQRLSENAMCVPASAWTFTKQDCAELVSYLRRLQGSGPC